MAVNNGTAGVDRIGVPGLDTAARGTRRVGLVVAWGSGGRFGGSLGSLGPSGGGGGWNIVRDSAGSTDLSGRLGGSLSRGLGRAGLAGGAEDRDTTAVTSNSSQCLGESGDEVVAQVLLVLPEHGARIPAHLTSLSNAGSEGGKAYEAVLGLVSSRGLANDDLVERNTTLRVDLLNRSTGEVAARLGDQVGAGSVLRITISHNHVISKSTHFRLREASLLTLGCRIGRCTSRCYHQPPCERQHRHQTCKRWWRTKGQQGRG